MPAPGAHLDADHLCQYLDFISSMPEPPLSTRRILTTSLG